MNYKKKFKFLGILLLIFIFSTCVAKGLIGFIFSLGLIITSFIIVVLFILYKKEEKNTHKN